MAQAITRQFGVELGGIDSQLLAARDLGRLQREKRRGETEQPEEQAPVTRFTDIPETTYRPGAYTSARQGRKLANVARSGVTAAGKEAVQQLARQGTNNLLRLAWLNVIDTFGLTLIYVNIHVFLRWVLGEQYFGKLGDEWVSSAAKEVTGGASDLAGRSAGIVEAGVLLLADSILLFFIAVILTLLILVVTWMEAGLLEKTGMTLQAIWNMGWDSVENLVKLFAL